MFKPTRTIACYVLRSVGVVVALLVPPENRYRVLWRALIILFPLLRGAYSFGNQNDRGRWRREWRALMLEQALAAMARTRPGFKIPVAQEGMDAVTEVLDRGEPAILCTAHFALTRAAFHLLAPERRAVLIADYDDKAYESAWASKLPLQILPSGVDVLARALPLLQEGRLLISFVDYRLDYSPDGIAYISPSIFRLGARASAAVFFFIPELERDGTIRIIFHRSTPARIRTPGEADGCADQFAQFSTERRGWRYVVRRRKFAATGVT